MPIIGGSAADNTIAGHWRVLDADNAIADAALVSVLFPSVTVSTAFESGIARRGLHHLAALQALGPTPVAPGRAPGWQPVGPLAATDPLKVWEAAA